MILLKKIDVFGQLACFGLLLFFVVTNNILKLFFAGYFILGGWQIISTLLHKLYSKSLLLRHQRVQYEKLLLGICLFALLCLLFNSLTILLAYGLLLGSPIMALWQIRFGFKELEIWKAREIVHLK